MDVTVTAPGVDALAARIEEAGAALGDLTPANSDAAAIALGEVRAPIRTGALSRTVEAVPDALGFVLRAGGPDAPYAGPVHARDPFLTRPIKEREGDIVDAYADHVDSTLDTI